MIADGTRTPRKAAHNGRRNNSEKQTPQANTSAVATRPINTYCSRFGSHWRTNITNVAIHNTAAKAQPLANAQPVLAVKTRHASTGNERWKSNVSSSRSVANSVAPHPSM